MKNKVIEIKSIEEFDALTEREQMAVYITFVRLQLYNKGLLCGPKAIQKRMLEMELQPPSTSTISRILRDQYLTHRRTGYYEGDYPG